MNTLLLIIWLHFISDFILQNDKMATQKSKSLKWLSIHIAVYSLLFFVFFGWQCALVNASAHWVTDFITSRITSRLWKAQKVHWFFVVIGFDQALHLTVLLLTMGLIK